MPELKTETQRRSRRSSRTRADTPATTERTLRDSQSRGNGLTLVPWRETVGTPFATDNGRGGTVYGRAAHVSGTRPAVVTLGQFDGVHRGHQALLAETVRHASLTGAAAGAITFDRHPMSLLAPHRVPRTLTELEEKVGHLLGSGLDFVVVLRLEPALLATEPTVFVDDVLVSTVGTRAVVVGPNFRFGRGASGDTALLARLGETRGFELFHPELSVFRDAAISSTRIRAAVAVGDLHTATAMLGRPHALCGHVLNLAGRQLSVALPDLAARPQAGRFAGRLIMPDQSDDAVEVAVTLLGPSVTVQGPRDLTLSGASGERAAVELVARGSRDHRAAGRRSTPGQLDSASERGKEQA